MSSLLHQLAFAFWAFRPEAASAYAEQVHRIMTGEQVVPETKANERDLMEKCNLHFVTLQGDRLDLGAEPIAPQAGLVAVLDLAGPIMKNDFCGAPGASTLARWMADFEATPEVTGVVMRVDSPGGDAYAMLMLASQIESMTKPVVSLVNAGQACSAAYGIPAAGDLIMSANDMDVFGSIGTYVRLNDYRGADEKRGIKVHTIKATRSAAKNRDFDEAMDGDPSNPSDPKYKALRENYVNPFNEQFIALVQRNRPGVKDENEVLEGKVFFAPDALMHGLIDSTGETLNSAIAAVRDLATKNQTRK